MTPILVFGILVVYFLALITISHLTSRGATTDSFFTANRQSPWYLVAFGMIGSSLSGVTFISVPGNVGKIGFGYFQVVLGYLAGYWIIIGILLPLYYRLKVVSIYSYLEQRFDKWAYRTGAFFFLISRTLGSSLRLYLAVAVLQLFLFDQWHIPFAASVIITLILIWLYTFRGGVKTIVWTDSFQTTFLVAAVVVSVWQMTKQMGFNFGDLWNIIDSHGYSKIFYWEDANAKLFFPKMFLGGAFITITMTGLDQEIMQKNLTCRTLGESQKNMFWFSLLLVAVNFLFLILGALLYIYCGEHEIAIPARTDTLYPLLAMSNLGLVAGFCFLLGIIASSYASADSALTGLTTSFCIDFLQFKNKAEKEKNKQKFWVHIGFSVVFLLIIVVFKEINEVSVIDAVLDIAGYTYGPLLGLFAFGIFTRRRVGGIRVPIVCVLSAVFSVLLFKWAPTLFNGYNIGFEIMLINGLFTFLGLWVISKKMPAKEAGNKK